MSLTNQLIATVLAVLLGLVLSTLYILSDSSRDTLLTQLESHAEDSATHLGLYLAPYMQQQDQATIATAVNAIFDSGFYQQIEVTDSNNNTLYSKTYDPASVIKAPNWFIHLMPITPPEKSRQIAFQWQQVGSIHVRSRAGYAYEKLWQGVRNALLLFASLSAISAIILSWLMRHLLRPLQGVEHQAMALARREYIEQPVLPRTRELRQVVSAMNLMVRQVQLMFDEQNRNIESLRSTAYRDSLTGLNNRRATLTQLTEHLEYRQDFGPASLLIFHLNDLQALNHLLGEDATNHLISRCAQSIQALGQNLGPHVVGRIGGADLVLLAQRRSLDDWQLLLEPLLHQVRSQVKKQTGAVESADILSIGIASCDTPTTSEQLLTQARLAQQEAEQGGNRSIALYHTQQHQQGWSDQWQRHVATAIHNEQIFLQQQQLVDNQNQCIHAEVFARILDQDNTPCQAGDFFGVARDLNLLEKIDRAIVKHALQHLQQKPECPVLSLNLANQALAEPAFIEWLLNTLKHSGVTSRLSIEINETAILTHMESIKALRSTLSDLNIHFGVDNFGTHPNGFSYLYALRPDYLKIDGSLIRHIDRSDEDRFFVSSLISVAHSLEIKAYAEHVERDSQRIELEKMKIDGTQGYLHGVPSTLS
ncbi:bifunctional diguanylate cyclase/phosphodiesterase [Marinobacterium sediminicola]|uniref:Diguanylate cyclase/phosphodiesterase n=1 Tax=Marinobacterium sediminicola TaxID=518898 RepID=A0ABY1RVM8_9GAMM|nr:EAL domain-containing protein [Marinobacterium sediminicola]ULG70592.1 EAL domain-containing protein [Marinobacterium sediminicola]SMR68921.1 diguanylate cyclase/phosphodiesterase [Marinobacterium sediminicola]